MQIKATDALIVIILIATICFLSGMSVGEALADETEVIEPTLENVTYLQAEEPAPTLRELNGYEVFTATAYCGCRECSDEWGTQSATGVKLQQGISVAADFDVLPPFTQIEVSGVGLFTVHDTGAAIEGNEIDIYFENHEDAEAFGVQEVWVLVCE